jgi:hypothetical protein
MLGLLFQKVVPFGFIRRGGCIPDEKMTYRGKFRRAIKAVDSTISVTTPSTANLAINSRISLDRSSAFARKRSREVTENERARSVKRSRTVNLRSMIEMRSI